MSELIIESEVKENEYKVTLPCKPDEFADFVSSILGKGLTIEKNYSDIFELDSNSIQQLYHLVTQRAAQNGGKLVAFNSKLYFSDRSSKSFNSPEDLFSHNEIKAIETSSLAIEMAYLIHFPGKPAPEKQSVSITFKPGSYIRHRGEYMYARDGEITLQVHHTEKTWANDVVNLFNDFISHHIYKPNKTTVLWNRLNDYISGVAGFLCFGVGLLGIVFSYNFISQGVKAAAVNVIDNQGESIKFLVLQSYDAGMVNFFVASVFYIGILIFISVFTAEKLNNAYSIPIRSQLIFTDQDRKAAGKKEKNSKSQVFGLTTELLKGLIIGVVANAVFTLIWY